MREDIPKGHKNAYKSSSSSLNKNRPFRSNQNPKLNNHDVSSKAVSRFEAVRQLTKEAAEQTKSVQVLLPAEPGLIELSDNSKTKVYKIKHQEMLQQVDANTARNAFDFKLPEYGPYKINYTRNGRYLLMGGQKGHIAIYDCHTMNITTELQLQQEVHDVQFLHNQSLFAVAQQKYVYIYDQQGIELHCLKKHDRSLKLEYLPYHFLLVSTGRSGMIRYHDISTGEYLQGYPMGHGPCHILAQNPSNAVIHAGHGNGVVSLWSPTQSKPLASLLCHKAPITDLAVDREGLYMTTVALDGYLKIWDIRKMEHIHAYKLPKPASQVDISDRGVIGVGGIGGRHVQLLKEAFLQPLDVTYLNYEISAPNAHQFAGVAAVANTRALASQITISSLAFRPLEDVITVGHSHGITSFIAPGTGEANFDSFEQNPFMNGKQRREAEVQNLLNKLSPDMITLDTDIIGKISLDGKKDTSTNSSSSRNNAAEKDTTDNEDGEAEEEEGGKSGEKSSSRNQPKEKDRKRGRNKIRNKLRRKQKNVIDEKYKLFQDAKQKRHSEVVKAQPEMGALSRFVK